MSFTDNESNNGMNGTGAQPPEAERKDIPQTEPEAQWTAPGYYAQEPAAQPDAAPVQEPQAPRAEAAPTQSAYGSPYTASPYGAPAYEQPAWQQAPQGNPYQAQYANPNAPYGAQPQAPQGDAARQAQPADYQPQGDAAYQAQNPYQNPYQTYQSAQDVQHRAPRTRRVWPAVVLTAISCLLVGALLGALLLPLFGVDLSAKPVDTTAQDPQFSLPDNTQHDEPVDTEDAEGMDPNFSFGDGSSVWDYAADGDLADMAEAVTPSIVGVLNLTYQTQNNYYGYGGYGNNPAQNSEPSLVETGSGSGVIITQDGYIVTNAHVVDGADALKVLMNDGEKVDAVLVGSDSVTDLAVVKVERTGLPAAQMGNSDSVRVGDLAVAIGNPLGSDLAGTVTMGIVSAKDRTIEVDSQYIDVLQTDAAINPGNSGGALVNSAGQVIGITSAKTVVAGYDAMGNAISAEGIGYAIPINNAKPIIEQIIRTGRVPRPAMGVSVQLVTNRLDAEQMGLLVLEVYEGSAAQASGLQVNDVITHMNGVSFTSLSEFKKELMKYQVGETVTLTVSRNNEENIKIELTLSDSSILDQEQETDDQTPDSQWQIPGYDNFDPFG